MLEDCSLITGKGGTNREGACKVLPLRKGGTEKVLAMLKGGGGGIKRFGVVLTRELEVLAILKGGVKRFHSLKGGGGATSFTLS